MSENKVTRWLRSASDFNFSLYCTAAAFGTYFCMYAFRKPFSVALFPGSVDLPLLPPMDYKIVLIVAQVIGYTISKFIGIKVISEMSGRPDLSWLDFFIGLSYATSLVTSAAFLYSLLYFRRATRR